MMTIDYILIPSLFSGHFYLLLSFSGLSRIVILSKRHLLPIILIQSAIKVAAAAADHFVSLLSWGGCPDWIWRLKHFELMQARIAATTTCSLGTDAEWQWPCRPAGGNWRQVQPDMTAAAAAAACRSGFKLIHRGAPCRPNQISPKLQARPKWTAIHHTSLFCTCYYLIREDPRTITLLLLLPQKVLGLWTNDKWWMHLKWTFLLVIFETMIATHYIT